MSDDKCPFCGEPRVRQCSTYNVFRCGTQGPDINGEYDTGRACDITTYQRLLSAKNAEIERLRAECEQIPVLTQAVAEALANFGKAQRQSKRLMQLCKASEHLLRGAGAIYDPGLDTGPTHWLTTRDQLLLAIELEAARAAGGGGDE